MVVWKYFKREVKTPLPSPSGSLSRTISSGGIIAANKEVQRMMDSGTDGTVLKSSVRTWMDKYQEDLRIRMEEGREMVVKKLPYLTS